MNWTRFINEQKDRHMSIAKGRGMTEAEAEDVVWGVYSRFIEKGYDEKYTGAQAGFAVRNACININDKRSRGRTDHYLIYERDLKYKLGYNTIVTGYEYLLQDTCPVELNPIDAQTMEVILEAVERKLTPRQWFIMQKVYMEGHPIAEVAEMLSVTSNTVRTTAVHSRQRLRGLCKEVKQYLY